MVKELNPLRNAKFGGGMFLTDFPAKIRVLTRDPLVYVNRFGNTQYAFVVFNIDDNVPQILDKGPGFAQRFQDIDADSDFGEDIRLIDLKVTTNGKPGIEVRYTITPVGSPYKLTNSQIQEAAKVDLETTIKKRNPNAVRLSRVNDGAELVAPPEEEPVQPDNTQDDVVIEDLDSEEININDIPF